MQNSIQKSKLPNGVRILTKAMPGVRSVSMGVWVDKGSRDELDSESGACHFIEHMVFKGTARRSAFAIAAELDAIGGHSNAFTSMEHLCLHGKVLDSMVGRLADVLSDLFLHPAFDPVEIERERDVVLQEIGMMEDTPEDLLHLVASRAFFGDHPLGRSILGSEKTLASFDRALLVDQAATLFGPENVVLAAAGNIEHNLFIDLIGPEFAGLTPGRPLPDRAPPVPRHAVAVEEKDLEQVHIAVAANGVKSSSNRRYALYLLNVILGGNMSSRLFQEVRERRGLAYSVYSFLSSYSDSGNLCIYAGVLPEKTEQAVHVIGRELAALSRKAPTQEELTAAKDYLKGSIFLSAESTDSQMLRIIQNETTFGRHVPLAEVARGIEAVTPEEIRELARVLLNPDTTALALLGPAPRRSDWSGVLFE
ncbi:MAG: pitrilysin family protein [Thermodesulfobacteriota bacterium]